MDTQKLNYKPAEEIVDYVFLLAVHMACADGQVHKNEIDTLQMLGKEVGINAATWDAMEDIFGQSQNQLSADYVIQRIDRSEYERALHFACYLAAIDGYIESTEFEFIERIKTAWRVDPTVSNDILSRAQIEADADRKAAQNSNKAAISHAARIIRGLDTVFSKHLINMVVNTVGSKNLKEKIDDHRTQALLSGPEYSDAINICRKIGEQDIAVADRCLEETERALIDLEVGLGKTIEQLKSKIGNTSATSAREVVAQLSRDKDRLNTETTHQLKKIIDLQEKKRRAINFFTLSFMGKSKAGKSTLHAIVTGEGWDGIGIGRQNTTRLNRVYEWHNIRIVDTPGIAAPDGAEYQRIAETIIDESDLMCFVVTNNNQQKSEFEFLKRLKEKGKPLLVLLNVQENLTNETRLKRFLDRPDDIFSDDKAKLGGHFDRIRRDAQEYYGTSEFPIIPVQLMAARLARQETDKEKAAQLMKASRLQSFLDAVRLSLISEGVIRRSQNLLGSTVSDIEQPLTWLEDRAKYYDNVVNTMQGKKIEAQERINKAEKLHQDRLKKALGGCFEELRALIPSFADTYWDASESSLNSAWKNQSAGFDKKLQAAMTTSFNAFSTDVKEILEEIGREIQLTTQLKAEGFSLSEQDSNDFGHKASKWTGGILNTLGGIFWAFPDLGITKVVAIGITVLGAVLSFFSSIFESKASKKRKAVARIAEALEQQIDKQEKEVISIAIKNFDEQCKLVSQSVDEYFQHIISGSKEIGGVLEICGSTIKSQRDELNMCFASRILDFAAGKPGNLDTEKVRQRIGRVERTVGHAMNITLSQPLQKPIDLANLEKTIQEEIIIKGVHA